MRNLTKSLLALLIVLGLAAAAPSSATAKARMCFSTSVYCDVDWDCWTGHSMIYRYSCDYWDGGIPQTSCSGCTTSCNVNPCNASQ